MLPCVAVCCGVRSGASCAALIDDWKCSWNAWHMRGGKRQVNVEGQGVRGLVVQRADMSRQTKDVCVCCSVLIRIVDID